MALFIRDFLFFLLPSFLLLLLCLALHWPRGRCWTGWALTAAGWRLWVIICHILELPLHNDTGATEVKSSGQTSDGARLICKPTALARYLLRHCGSLARPGLAGWPRGDPHLQTVCSQLWEQRELVLQFTRDHLQLRDGGVVALDWAVGTRAGEATERRRKEHQTGGKTLGCFTSAPPVLLLVPQCWGGMTPHLRALCHQAMRQGFYVVVFHPRGTAGSPLTTARLTEFGDPADLEQAVSYVHSRLPSSALVAVSEGSGSGVLLSYLGESGSSTHLTAAAAISPVLLGQTWFETAMPPVYRWGALFQRKQPLRRYASSFSGVLDVDRALRCSSLRDFEEALFCSSSSSSSSSSPPSSPGPPPRGRDPSVAWALGERAYPAEDWAGYWERNEPLREADEVAVPLLCICSEDDPLLPPASSLPLHLFQSSPFFLLLLADRGGHCGFALQEEAQEEVGGAVWSHTAVLEYFKVVADFLKAGEREGSSWGGPKEEDVLAELRSRLVNPAPLRRRRLPPITRKPRHPAASCEEEEEAFTWRRSYTR